VQLFYDELKSLREQATHATAASFKGALFQLSLISDCLGNSYEDTEWGRKAAKRTIQRMLYYVPGVFHAVNSLATVGLTQS
jgi:hypothetical protein